MISRNEDGTCDVGGSYNADVGNIRIREILQKGNYLDYFGMKLIDEGFSYHVKGIDPNRGGVAVTANNRLLLINDSYLISELKRRFGTSINIEAAWTKENQVYVGFNFPDQMMKMHLVMEKGAILDEDKLNDVMDENTT